MIIYEQEIQDNLEDIIKSTASISIASVAQPSIYDLFHKDSTNIIGNNKLSALASYDDKDLYYVQSILVSSSWNKNDDIFTKEEVWAAKNTPEDKPTNLEHNENLIIGHIVSNWPIDDDGQILNPETPVNELPDKFHIVTGSVIYKAYTTPELKERAEKLIAEIENGTKYVSMECMFSGFDYGLINNTNGEYKVLARSNETAFLTKHLRAYGGNGEYDNHKVGRVLRNITFSGKGYVDKPANPDSIIFTKDNFLSIANIKNNKNNISGVSEIRPNNMENTNMSLEKEVADLKEKVEAMSDCASATKEAYTQVAELKDKVIALETELQNTKSAYDALVSTTEAAKKMSEEEMMKKEEEMKKAKSELDEALAAVAAYKNKEEEMMKKEKKMKRMASLIEKGIDQEVVASTVDQFETLEDATFEAMVALFTEAAKKKAEMPVKEEKKTASTEVVSQPEEALENVETNTEDLDLSAGSDHTETVDTTRAALVDFVCARLGKKLNKGE